MPATATEKRGICADLTKLFKQTDLGANIDFIGFSKDEDCAIIFYTDTAPLGVKVLATRNTDDLHFMLEIIKAVLL